MSNIILNKIGDETINTISDAINKGSLTFELVEM